MLKYLKGISYMELTLSIGDLSKIMWWVDASDWTHNSQKGHTSTMMLLSGRAVISSSQKKNQYYTVHMCVIIPRGSHDVR